ncbi:MAG: hypothetical protein HC845_05065 [Akkermansiaceae bacterium]|nr:hypothetical protein [Akkermansiaceae bacterium]
MTSPNKKTPPLLWIGLFALAAVCAVGVYFYKKQQDELRIATEARAAQAAKEKEQTIITNLASARDAASQTNWADAIASAQLVLKSSPDNSEAKTILSTATAALEKIETDKKQAASLLEKAIASDQGKYDPQAISWLNEAKSLDPGNTAIPALLGKISAYPRTIRIPEDAATPAAALATARDGDTISLSAGNWQGPLTVGTKIHLQGAAGTIIECPAEAGCAITIAPDAKGAQITGINFRHNTAISESERFSAALVRGGNATFIDCQFINASGHGLAVIDGGSAIVSRSQFSENGWNGAAVIGTGSKLDLRDSKFSKNQQNGIESWNGATVVLISNHCEANGRNGIHVGSASAGAIIEGNQLTTNSEYGAVIDRAEEGKIQNNIAKENQLGGFVIRSSAAKISINNNQAIQNKGPGWIMEKGLDAANYTSNTSSENGTQEIITDASFTENTAAPQGESNIPRANPVEE